MGLAFRYFSDSNTHGAGFWADDVRIDGALVSGGSTLDGWLSGTEYNPVEVEGYTVRLVAYGNGNRAWTAEISLDENLNGVLTGGELRSRIGFRADTVAAIVTYHDSTEQVLQYAPYILQVRRIRSRDAVGHISRPMKLVMYPRATERATEKTSEDRDHRNREDGQGIRRGSRSEA